MTPADPPSDAVGRLLASVQEWARVNLPAAAEHATTCQWCPLCQFATVLRGEHPEVSNQFAEAAAAVAGALRALLDSSARPPAPRRRPRPTPRVERIELGEDE